MSKVKRIVIVDIDSDRETPVSIKYFTEQFGNDRQELDLVADMQVLSMGIVTLISAADKNNIKSKRDSLDACIRAITEGVEKSLLDGKVTG